MRSPISLLILDRPTLLGRDFPTPVPFEALPMPPDHGLRLDDNQS